MASQLYLFAVHSLFGSTKRIAVAKVRHLGNVDYRRKETTLVRAISCCSPQ